MTGFGRFVARAAATGELVVQPRMGMADPVRMRAGLTATRRARATTAGTITLDSYTRTAGGAAAGRALARGVELNGYPIATHEPEVTRAVLDGVADDSFPVQVRHGSARPEPVFHAMAAAGLSATEGGPVSYCLPYGRTPLRDAVASWEGCCRRLAEQRARGAEPHLETFGGCMMGQLCPPDLLVALSVLEALFFRQHGLRSVSLSYAQQTDPDQDAEAVRALRRIAADLLPDVEWHVVLYTYMGVHPLTPGGAQLLQDEAARLAVRSGAARLIVKTSAEAHRIPTVAENVLALETAAAVAAEQRRLGPSAEPPDTGVHDRARGLVDAVRDLHRDLGRALLRAFARGYLDVPYCLHPDNAGRSRGGLDDRGRLCWTDTGAMPLPAPERSARARRATGSAELLDALSHVQRTFDHRAFAASAVPTHRSHLPNLEKAT